MNIDFLHNQIIRDTITPKFIESFNDNLVPYLMSEYGSSLEQIQFYEDHLASGLRIGGEFYYPLTVVVSGKPIVRCVSWQVSNYRNYDKFNPFSYKGREPLEFNLLDEIPDAVKAAIKGKSIYFNTGSAVPVSVTFTGDDKTFLAGKYSQGFIDIMAKSLTEIIEREFNISGLASSGVVIEISYAPGTFMEHIVGNTTYRRALLLARGCAARDLWIKWTRLDGFGTYTVSDNVTEDEIEFALAEDVSGKIREKEYRYLTASGVNKYQAAMSRKNITEWRDVMRRVIRRAEVTVAQAVAEIEEVVKDEEPFTYPEPEIVKDIPAVDELISIIDDDNTPDVDTEYDDELSALLKSAIGLTSAVSEETESEPAAFDDVVEQIADEEEPDIEEEADIEEPDIEEEADTEEEGYVRIAPTANSAEIDEERIRYEIEQKIRAEMEAELALKAREAEELRMRLEEKLRAEAREKELLAEAARAAIAEQQRLAKEREERERREAEEREAAARREAEERAERERREAEAKAKAEAEARARAEAEAKAKAEAQKKAEEANYVSKKVKLIFKHQIDQSITSRIHEIIVATIKYYHKEDVYIKIKATIPDITTVNLEFVKIPENEVPLIVNIIKVLGRSDLGITRATLD